MDKFIFKLIRDNETNDVFKLSGEFKENIFNLAVFKNSNAWAVSVDHNDIRNQAKELEIDVQEYLEKLLEYLKNMPANVHFNFTDNKFIVNCTLQNNIKLKYFSYKLKEVEYSEYAEMLMEKFYSEWHNSVERLIFANKEKMEIEKCNTLMQSKLNELIERKNREDAELYSNFVLVLNEKKKKIQQLDEILQALKTGRPLLNPPPKGNKRTKKSASLKEDISGKDKKEINFESDSEEYDTDDEKLRKQNLTSNFEKTNDDKKNVLVAPCTSKFDLLADDSLPKHVPKRIKSETNINNNTYLKPSTSKSSISINEKTKIKLDCTAFEETPNINFSTQELLDNL